MMNTPKPENRIETEKEKKCNSSKNNNNHPFAKKKPKLTSGRARKIFKVESWPRAFGKKLHHLLLSALLFAMHAESQHKSHLGDLEERQSMNLTWWADGLIAAAKNSRCSTNEGSNKLQDALHATLCVKLLFATMFVGECKQNKSCSWGWRRKSKRREGENFIILHRFI